MQPEGALKIFLKGKEMPLKGYYAQAENAGVSALINSSGYLEVFIYRGSAASECNILPGDIVKVAISSS